MRIQLGKPRGVGAGLSDLHNYNAANGVADAFCGDAGAAAGPWAHPAKRRRCSRANSALSSQGALVDARLETSVCVVSTAS